MYLSYSNLHISAGKGKRDGGRMTGATSGLVGVGVGLLLVGCWFAGWLSGSDTAVGIMAAVLYDYDGIR